MAKLRTIKRDIAYLTGEIISNGYMAIYFQGEDAKASLTDVITKTVDNYNALIVRANHPPEKNNPKLVRKHYTAIRAEMLECADKMFSEISAVCSK